MPVQAALIINLVNGISRLPLKSVESESGRGVGRIEIRIKKLPEGGEEVRLSDRQAELFRRPFRVQIRVPDHRCGIKGHGHFANRDVHPFPGPPAKINLTEIDSAGAFAERAVIWNTTGGSSEGVPGRARIVGGLKCQTVIKVIQHVAAQAEEQGVTPAFQTEPLIGGCVGLAIFVAHADVAVQLHILDGIADFPFGRRHLNFLIGVHGRGFSLDLGRFILADDALFQEQINERVVGAGASAVDSGKQGQKQGCHGDSRTEICPGSELHRRDRRNGRQRLQVRIVTFV